MKKIFAILIALSALSNFSCKEKEEEYTEGGLVFGGIYMLDGQQLVETDGYILELPAEQNTVELRIVSKGVQEFGIGGYPMSGLGEYKVEGFTIKVTPDPASEKLEIYDYIDVEYKGEQHRVPRQCEGHPFADAPTRTPDSKRSSGYGSSRTFQTIGWSGVNSPSGRRADKGKRSLTTPFFMLQTDRSRPFRRIFSPSSHLGRVRASAALHPP